MLRGGVAVCFTEVWQFPWLLLRYERGKDNERWFCVNGGSVPQWWPGLVAGANCCNWCVVHGAGAAIDERGGRAASGVVKALTA